MCLRELLRTQFHWPSMSQLQALPFGHRRPAATSNKGMRLGSWLRRSTPFSVALRADSDAVRKFAAGKSKVQLLLGVLARLSEDAEASIVANRRQLSSNGVPVPSPLPPLMTREKLKMDVQDTVDAFDLRDDSDVNRNIVCSATPNFCSSMSRNRVRVQYLKRHLPV